MQCGGGAGGRFLMRRVLRDHSLLRIRVQRRPDILSNEENLGRGQNGSKMFQKKRYILGVSFKAVDGKNLWYRLLSGVLIYIGSGSYPF